jgi:hypothetical protein
MCATSVLADGGGAKCRLSPPSFSGCCTYFVNPRRLTLPSSGQPPEYRRLPLNSNVRRPLNQAVQVELIKATLMQFVRVHRSAGASSKVSTVAVPSSARAVRPSAASARLPHLNRRLKYTELPGSLAFSHSVATPNQSFERTASQPLNSNVRRRRSAHSQPPARKFSS